MNAPLLPVPVPAAEERAPVWAWSRLRGLVVDSVASAHSRRAYGRAFDRFREWCVHSGAEGFTRETVQRYRSSLEAERLSPSTVNVHLAAIRRLARESAAAHILSSDEAAAIRAVPGARGKGKRLGTWLTLAQAQELLEAPAGDGLRAVRDRALVALLVGSGVRRDELARLRFEQIQQREGRWVIVDVDGKGRRLRSIPLPGWAQARVERWRQAAGLTQGHVLRAVSQGGEVVGQAITPQAVYLIVRGYARQLGIPFAPHDLRRTFAQLAHKGRSPLEQIQMSLGHESILTTEKYLGVRQSLTDAPCDHLGIDLEQK